MLTGMNEMFNGAPRTKKRFSTSYSRIKNFEACPRKHEAYDITKRIVEETSDQLAYGDFVHKSLAKACRDNEPLPAELLYLQPWANKVRDGPGKLLVEQQYAITAEFAPCAWFSPVALALDWKTGKIVEDSVQLAIMAQMIMCHHPEINVVRAEFVWLAHECTTRDTFTKDKLITMWPGLFARIAPIEQAFNTGVYPPKPSGLCVRHCGDTTCEFHGKGTRK